MDPATALQAMQAWPVEDRLTFIFNAWDQLLDGGWRPELTGEIAAELERRLRAHEADPGNVLTWDQIVAHVRRPR